MRFRWLWSTSDEDEAADKRRRRRRKAGSRGLLVHRDWREPVPGTITDLTDNGARVSFETDRRLPERVFLIDLDQGKAHEADVVWRSAREAGLQFVCSVVLDATTPSEMKHLRELWLREA